MTDDYALSSTQEPFTSPVAIVRLAFLPIRLVHIRAVLDGLSRLHVIPEWNETKKLIPHSVAVSRGTNLASPSGDHCN